MKKRHRRYYKLVRRCGQLEAETERQRNALVDLRRDLEDALRLVRRLEQTLNGTEPRKTTA